VVALMKLRRVIAALGGLIFMSLSSHISRCESINISLFHRTSTSSGKFGCFTFVDCPLGCSRLTSFIALSCKILRQRTTSCFFFFSFGHRLSAYGWPEPFQELNGR
jgi:hypothetical protein